jgi:hypothetical protein
VAASLAAIQTVNECVIDSIVFGCTVSHGLENYLRSRNYPVPSLPSPKQSFSSFQSGPPSLASSLSSSLSAISPSASSVSSTSPRSSFFSHSTSLPPPHIHRVPPPGLGGGFSSSHGLSIEPPRNHYQLSSFGTNDNSRKYDPFVLGVPQPKDPLSVFAWK